MINILKTDDVRFMISGTQYIKINNKSIKKDACEQCAQTDIDYVDEASNICIRFGYSDIESICNFIVTRAQFKKLIQEESVLDLSLVADLGLEYNQSYYQGVPFKFFNDYWFDGNAHKQIRPYYDSWLYNDKDGNVIFEITPFYPWHGETKKTCPDKIPYRQWIKDYKPTLKTIISKENLKKWIEQALELKKSLGLHKD